MKRNTVFYFLFLTIIFILTACGTKPVEPAAATQNPQDQTLIAEGQLLPANAVDLSFTVSGQVDRVLVEDEDRVGSGQLLAQLVDNPQAEADLARAEQDALAAQQALDDYNAKGKLNLAQAQLEVINTRNKYKTARDNYLNGRTTERKARMDEAEAKYNLAQDALKQVEVNDGLDPDQLAVLQAQLKTAQTALESAQAAVDARQLKASITGTAADVKVQEGQQVKAGEPVIAVADFSKWLVKTDSLTEFEVVGVQAGQEVDVILHALPETTLKGIVTDINSRFEEKRGDITYTVTIELTQTDPLMRWGMTAAVYFIPKVQ